ncbi:hypothetical protein MLD38_014307 [Melastoma candidum]|uniref:Uncharacterized protein n=1 Tax=Melastoma candidum TaxID=119954 RepID=A0ACB9RCE8_9MYRT|nr:hypothetical protein MLD38_014307 [Melastoma candidum]
MMAAVKRLTRNWGKNKPGDDDLSLPTRDNFQPMDTSDQEDLVRSFERSHARQSLLWRSVFAVLLSLFAAFLVYSIYQQTFYPWELRHHAYFMEDIPLWTVLSADWLAVLACSMATIGVLKKMKHHRHWQWSACFLSVVLAMFWLSNMMRMPRFRWDILWLPFGPLCGSMICLYVDHVLEESSEEVRKLRGYMYSYKAI